MKRPAINKNITSSLFYITKHLKYETNILEDTLFNKIFESVTRKLHRR